MSMTFLIIGQGVRLVLGTMWYMIFGVNKSLLTPILGAPFKGFEKIGHRVDAWMVSEGWQKWWLVREGKDGCWHQLRRGLSESGSVINQPPTHRAAKSEIRMLKLKRWKYNIIKLVELQGHFRAWILLLRCYFLHNTVCCCYIYVRCDRRIIEE